MEYQHRLTPSWALYGQAWAGWGRYEGIWAEDLGAQVGVRYRW